MSLDFLRRLAFDGELSYFFGEDRYQLGERSTGLHLRFDPEFLSGIGRIASEHPLETDNWYTQRDFRTELNDALGRWGGPLWPGHHWYGRFGDRFEKNPREIVQIIVDVKSTDDPLFSDGPRDYEGFPIIYRESGPIVPHYAPGCAIQSATSSKAGTLCGFLRDQAKNKTLALTCGHVVEMLGGTVVDPLGKFSELGWTRDIEIPTAQGNCNRHAQSNANGVDAALIELNELAPVTAGITRMVEPIASITAGDFVEFFGRGSRRPRPAMIMSATIWKPIDLLGDGNLICYGDIFEISHRSTPYVNSTLSKPGDSGSAVTKDGAPDRWLGMLIGGQRSSSYVCYAEHIMDWAESVCPGIILVP